jgi:hypothetical protein
MHNSFAYVEKIWIPFLSRHISLDRKSCQCPFCLSAQTASLDNAGLLPLTGSFCRLVLGVIRTLKEGKKKCDYDGKAPTLRPEKKTQFLREMELNG